MAAYPMLVRELDLMSLRVCPSKNVAWSPRGLPANLQLPHGCQTPANGLAVLKVPSVHQLKWRWTCGNAFINTSPPSLSFPFLGTHSWRWPPSPAASGNGLAICNEQSPIGHVPGNFTTFFIFPLSFSFPPGLPPHSHGRPWLPVVGANGASSLPGLLAPDRLFAPNALPLPP
eukprot:SM000338S12943  [mRNA]  locus=s338:84628:85188:- [translate_table: standard]